MQQQTSTTNQRGLRIVHDDVFRRLCVARDYIEASAVDAVALGEAAQKAGLSRFHFLRLFQQVFGETPHDYRTRLRIERAKALLEHRRDLTVTDVCLEVGFSSLGSFSSLFARRVGMPPSAYQRSVRAMAQVPGALVRRHIPCCFLLRFGPPSLSQF